MKVYALWYGGSSYAAPSIPEDIEEFDSIREARDVFESRADFDPYFPCVDESSEMHLFFADPRESGEEYPDRVLFLGPRGGVRMDHA